MGNDMQPSAIQTPIESRGRRQPRPRTKPPIVDPITGSVSGAWALESKGSRNSPPLLKFDIASSDGGGFGGASILFGEVLDVKPGRKALKITIGMSADTGDGLFRQADDTPLGVATYSAPVTVEPPISGFYSLRIVPSGLIFDQLF